jgi:hypothetical protein
MEDHGLAEPQFSLPGSIRFDHNLSGTGMVELETGPLQLIDQMVVDEELSISSDVYEERALQQTGKIRPSPLTRQESS